MTGLLHRLACSHAAMPDDVDADGRRICPTCGLVTGPPRDLAASLASMYLSLIRQGGHQPTEEQEAFAADLARRGGP